MRRVVCAWLPNWPTDRLRRHRDVPPDEPLVTTARQGARRLVLSADAAARARGIRPGMTVALAQALTPGLRVVEADLAGDAAALERLAVWALRYAPLAAADLPDALVIDVAGAAHLHGGEPALLADLKARLARAGFAAEVALAGSRIAARGLARFRPGTIVPAGETEAAVAPLPVEALRLDAALADALHGLGLDAIGDLGALSRAALLLRFGPALVERLDAARGHAYEALDPVLAPALPHVRLGFADPLGHLGGLRRALGRLAALLGAELERGGLGALRLDLRLHRVDGHVAALRAGAARATRDPAHMARLFRDGLETVDPGFGIEAMVLAAARSEPLGARQTMLGDEETEAGLAVLVDRLGARLGAARLYRLAVAESHVPERGVRALPALAPPTGRTWGEGTWGEGLRGDGSWGEGPRPQRLFDPPRPVEVVALLPDHPPAAYTWEGQRRRVRAADGPESVAGEWWVSAEESFETRDYFRTEDEAGLRLWLFRATRPDATRWFVQGVFA